MRRIASAISGATDSWRIVGDAFIASVAWIESVVMTSTRGDAAMRATAPPYRTPWVL